MTVVVVGGGIAGLGIARGLVRRGEDVTVLERDTVSSGATWGSAGWICPVQTGPLPEPGLIRYGLRSLVDRDSALYIDPRYMPSIIPWLTRFARACNERAYQAGAAALAKLGYRAFQLVDELIAEGAQFELFKRGMIVASAREAPVRAFLHQLVAPRKLGYQVPAEPLPAQSLRELEPSLSPELLHGVLIADHWHVDSGQMAVAISQRLREQGVRIEEHTAVDAIIVENGRARGVRTPAGTVEADTVVLAAGAWTTALTRPLGIRLPVIGGKGYSFFVRPHTMPTHSLLLLDPHVGCAPLGELLRIAGTMELSGLTSPIDLRRIETIKRGARPLLGWDTSSESEPWAGLRPLAPDGLPVIGRLDPLQGLYVATGYSMLGITIGLPAGEALAELIVGNPSQEELAAFSPQRFRRSVPSMRRRPATATPAG
jgi:D-amino-acid dehydrogenase